MSDTESGLPTMPPISEAVVIRHKGGLKGDIELGEIFAWEPDLPHARELLVVTGFTDKDHLKLITVDHPNGVALITAQRGEGVLSKNLAGGQEYWNSMGRFREACFRTRGVKP